MSGCGIGQMVVSAWTRWPTTTRPLCFAHLGTPASTATRRKQNRGNMHPKERHTRRRFLQNGGAGIALLSGAAPLLAACSNKTAVSASTGSGGKLLGPSGLPLARPDQPVKYKLWRDPIAAGMAPERGGTFNVFNYADYLYPKVAKDFGDKYDVKV